MKYKFLTERQNALQNTVFEKVNGGGVKNVDAEVFCVFVSTCFNNYQPISGLTLLACLPCN